MYRFQSDRDVLGGFCSSLSFETNELILLERKTKNMLGKVFPNLKIQMESNRKFVDEFFYQRNNDRFIYI